MQPASVSGELARERARMRLHSKLGIWKNESANLKEMHFRILVDIVLVLTVGAIGTVGLSCLGLYDLGSRRRAIERDALKLRSDVTTSVEEVNPRDMDTLEICACIMKNCSAIEKRWGRKSKQTDARRLGDLKTRWELWKES
jgi:hypothetical protein